MPVDTQALRDWHRWFGLVLSDFFTGSPFAVDVERDLSEQQQFLDVAIERRRHGDFAGRLPDGMDDLTDHNLFTFKSHQETLDAWAIRELLGHSVAYRKLVSPSPSRLLPEDLFRLYAVSARFPQNLAGQVPWQERQEGVYDCQWGLDIIRVIVAGQLPREPHNVPLHLFSADPELLAFAQGVYRPVSDQTTLVLGKLFDRFEEEGFTMSYTMQDFTRDYLREKLEQLSSKDRKQLLRSLTPEHRREILQAASPEERREILEASSPEERLAGLPPEERLAGLAPEERLAGLSPQQIRRYLDQLSPGRPSKPRKPQRKK
jgi:hypothetical protein